MSTGTTTRLVCKAAWTCLASRRQALKRVEQKAKRIAVLVKDSKIMWQPCASLCLNSADFSAGQARCIKEAHHGLVFHRLQPSKEFRVKVRLWSNFRHGSFHHLVGTKLWRAGIATQSGPTLHGRSGATECRPTEQVTRCASIKAAAASRPSDPGSGAAKGVVRCELPLSSWRLSATRVSARGSPPWIRALIQSLKGRDPCVAREIPVNRSRQAKIRAHKGIDPGQIGACGCGNEKASAAIAGCDHAFQGQGVPGRRLARRRRAAGGCRNRPPGGGCSRSD